MKKHHSGNADIVFGKPNLELRCSRDIKGNMKNFYTETLAEKAEDGKHRPNAEFG